MRGKAPADEKATPNQSVNKACSAARASKEGAIQWGGRGESNEFIFLSRTQGEKKEGGRGVWGNPLERNKARRDFQPHGGGPRSGSETNGIQTVSHD